LNPHLLLEALPDEALVPVGFVRRLLAERAAEQPDPVADLSVADVAAAFGRKTSTVRGWCTSARLPAYKLNGREWRVTREALRAYQDAQRAASAAPARSRPRRPGREAGLGSWRAVRARRGSP
jgi:excisionase family DNA binding protein